GKKLDFLLDVGCGGGQSVNIFAPYFNQVLAIDPSENQLKEARSQNQFAHVTYKQGNAEKLPRDDVSVDVITVGTAVHWFDRPKFYEEANRPGGRLIIFGYYAPDVVPLTVTGSGADKLSEIGSQLMYEAFGFPTKFIHVFDRIHAHGRDKNQQVMNEMPFPNKWRCDNLSKEYLWSLVDVKGFLQSIDVYEPYMKSKEIELEGLSAEERKSLKESWGCAQMENSDVKMKVIFNFFVTIAEKSK
uniref:Methyltransferase type 11 domain-containing protein n=1 Tax=Ciona intestinalis TaxID=7719 RepID=H2XQ96_CIOIN